MNLLSLKKPPKVRSIWRAMLAGVITHPLSALILGTIYWVIRPFVWAAIYSEPYRIQSDEYLPDSGQWLFAEGIGFCASIISGVMVAYWSPPPSRLPLMLLVALSFAALLLTPFPFETSILRNAIYAVHTPLGLLIGATLFQHWRATSESI